MRIAAFAGPIGSGKSSIADHLANRTGAVRRSFGAAVREIAEERSIPTDRSSLQDLGELVIAEEGWDWFTSRTVGDSVGGDLVVLDGVRHVGAVEALERCAEDGGFHLIYVDCRDEVRFGRLSRRDGIGLSEATAVDAHANEREALLVRARADLVISNDVDEPDVVAAIGAEVITRLGLT